MKKMLSFHGNKDLKNILLEEIKEHEKADQIIQGVYSSNSGRKWRGCAVGCSIHSLNVKLGKEYYEGDHSVYETELGIPRVLARLEDRIFEGLPVEDAKKFPAKFINAVPVGVDLMPVFYKLMVWLLEDEKDGVKKFARKDGKKAIDTVCKLYKKKIKGKEVTMKEWSDARAAAYAAAAAAYADSAAADAAAYAAAYADSARRTARQKHYKKIANKLIQLLKESSPKK